MRARAVRLQCVSASSPQHPHELPLPVEIPVTDNVGTEDLGLKTQVIRFGITGGLSALVDFGLLLLLLALGMEFWIAKSLSFIAGTTTAYMINRRWTFNAPHSNARFIAVVILYAVTFAVQVGISNALYHWLPQEWWRVAVAFVIAQGTATVINFIVQRVVIFKID
jgi:putative flippase GtrA